MKQNHSIDPLFLLLSKVHRSSLAWDNYQQLSINHSTAYLVSCEDDNKLGNLLNFLARNDYDHPYFKIVDKHLISFSWIIGIESINYFEFNNSKRFRDLLSLYNNKFVFSELQEKIFDFSQSPSIAKIAKKRNISCQELVKLYYPQILPFFLQFDVLLYNNTGLAIKSLGIISQSNKSIDQPIFLPCSEDPYQNSQLSTILDRLGYDVVRLIS